MCEGRRCLWLWRELKRTFVCLECCAFTAESLGLELHMALKLVGASVLLGFPA